MQHKFIVGEKKGVRHAVQSARQPAVLQELYTVVHDTRLPVLSLNRFASDSHVKSPLTSSDRLSSIFMSSSVNAPWAPTSWSRLDVLLRSPPIQDLVSMRLAYSPFLANVCYRGLSATLRKVHALRESGSLRVAQLPSFARVHTAWSLERAQQRTGNCA